MTPNQLAPPKQPPLEPLHNFHRVPHLRQLRRRRLGDALLQEHTHIQRLPEIRHPRADAHAGRVQRRLRVHLEGQHVQQDLHVALGLHEPAHDAVAGVQATVLRVGDHGGDDGVVGSLPRREAVRVVGLQLEVAAAVLEREAAAGGDDAAAEAGVVAVDEGGGVAVFVGNAEVDRVGVVVGRRTVVQWGRRLLGIEDLGAFGKVGLRDELLRRDLLDVGVGHPPAGVGEGDAQGFDDGVKVGGGVVILLSKAGDLALFLELLEYAERHEGDDALAVGRVLPHLHAMVFGVVGAVDKFALGLADVLSTELL